jgi:beta-galactosidase
MRFSDRVNYMTILGQMHRALYEMNIGADFVFPETENLSRYKVLLVPPLYVASDTLLNRLSEYVRQGGQVVMSFKSGFANEYSTVRWEKAPGPLREAAGFYYQEFSNLTKPLLLKGDPFKVGEANKVSVWAEFLIPETAETLATYADPFFGQYPAITRNKFGKGSLTYQGTFLSMPLQKAVLKSVLEGIGAIGPDQSLPGKVRVKHGVNNQGSRVHFYLNYSGEQQGFDYPYESGADILTEKSVEKDATIMLEPWGLVIVFEG